MARAADAHGVADGAATLRVDVVHCPGPGVTDCVALVLPAGSLLADAVLASGLAARHGLPAGGLLAGVWSSVKDAATPLRDGDRVEIYRPLQVDPKEARRQRYKRHQERLAAAARAQR